MHGHRKFPREFKGFRIRARPRFGEGACAVGAEGLEAPLHVGVRSVTVPWRGVPAGHRIAAGTG